mmetsp:Transcript_16323/g.34510  ORF Transcript_16323/g.34510 Transcript_16323/m.34510 type:complete len:896 (-) Transcript_16323:21-2708(-)
MRKCHRSTRSQAGHRPCRIMHYSFTPFAAAIIFSSCLLLWTHHTPTVSGFMPTNRPRAIAIHPSASHSPSQQYASNGLEERHTNGNSVINKRSRYRKRHQLRQKQQWRSNNYLSSQHSRLTSSRRNNNNEEVDEVQEWLLQSTFLILGEDLTLDLVKGGIDTEFTSPGQRNEDSNQTEIRLPSYFSTKNDFVLNSESVMRAWCRWISRSSSINNGGIVQLSLDDDVHKALLCPAINVAKIVDAILNRVLVIGDNEQGALGKEGDEKGNAMDAVEWETKIVELANVAIYIDARANAKNSDEAVSRAEGWLHFLKERLGDEMNSSSQCVNESVLRLYEESYRGVITACIRSRERRYLGRAMELLEDLSAPKKTPHIGSHDMRLHPTTKTYNQVLYGLANCEPCEGNAKHAEKILEEMIASCSCMGASNTCMPDSNTFRQVITAWTKSGSNVAATNARRILDQMISDFPTLDPDESSFNAIIHAYLKLGKTDEALALFDLMSSLHESGRIETQPDVYSVNLMLKAMTKQPPYLSLEEMEKVEECLENLDCPDKQSYNIVLDAWSKSQLRDAATRAELLLQSMEQRCRHDPKVTPDSYSFTSTINAIERSWHHNARGSWAEKLFNWMKELHSEGVVEEPTAPVHNALLNTLVCSDESGAIERAEILFSEMQAANLTNTRSFNTMLKGYAMMERKRADGRIVFFSRPRKAEQLLDQMEFSHFYEGTTTSISPDKYSYTTVISAYGRSNSRRKAAKAFEILHRMIDSYVEGNKAAKPGTFAFNAVLNSCAHTRHSEERLEGFTILCSTLILLKEWARPDHTTYGTFLQGCSRLLPTDEARKWRVVETVFNKCVVEGLCGQTVVKNLKDVASPELYDALVGRYRTDDGLDIPLDWRRNVAEQ